MRILFDTNVVLDVLLKREAHAATAVRLFAAVEEGIITGLLGATTITTIFYLATKKVGATQARQEIQRLLTIFTVASVNHLVLGDALRSKFDDYEDAVLYEAARQNNAHGIVTRAIDDFRSAVLRIYTPDELLAIVLDLGRTK